MLQDEEDALDHPLPLTSLEVYRWPEFKALCLRLGVRWEARTTRLVIDLPGPDAPIRVTHEYLVPEEDDEPTVHVEVR
jgi:hypothetical protein